MGWDLNSLECSTTQPYRSPGEGVMGVKGWDLNWLICSTTEPYRSPDEGVMGVNGWDCMGSKMMGSKMVDM